MMPRNDFHGEYENYEDNLNDPLANVEQFNIIQFLDSAENDYPYPMGEEHQQMPQGNGQIVKNERNNVQGNHQTNNAMYQISPGVMPDSPSNTEPSGSGSTASPSSNSDPPYSPDTFAAFGLGGHRIADGGLILGLNDIQKDIMLQDFDGRKNSRSNQVQSPQCFMSPYPLSHQPTPHSYSQAISPDENQQYPQGNYFNSMNTSSDVTLNTQNGDAPNNRKRPRFDPTKIDPTTVMNVAMGTPNPSSSSPAVEMYSMDDVSQPSIKFSKYQEELWGSLYDINGRQLNHLQVHVVADKGFNFSTNDNCFVNQKKNHFQISVHVEAMDSMPPKMIRHNGILQQIKDFKLSFTGVKCEMPAVEICIRQSRTDRKPHPHTPVLFEIQERRMTKVTVPRLHFSETTMNNQRKNLRPNPEQKYFWLVARLAATTFQDEAVLIQSYASEKVIVRAANPGSFEPPESEIGWNKNNTTLYTHGAVAIGGDKALAKLTVDGDIYSTGRVICPSDIRLKENITEKAAQEALENLCKLRIVDYFYKPEVADKWGLDEEQRKRTGVIAQELAAVLPDAVRDIGDYLTVNESRVFYETVLATQELCRLTGNLDNKIDEKVAEISQRLAKYVARKKLLASRSSNLNKDSAFDKDSMVSFSRNSLASTANTIRNPRKNRTSSKVEETICGSKLAQGTIVTLVGVMALCLLTMSTLYVLDWHNRNYGYHHVYSQSSEVNPEKYAPANLVVVSGDLVPISQPNAPPIMPHCTTTSCQDYCCEQEPVHENTADDEDDFTLDQYEVPEVSVSDYPIKLFGTGVKISLPQFGMDIDNRYCIEGSCNKRKQVFNLFIPISKHYPTVPIEIKIEVPSTKLINNCGYLPDFNHKKCIGPMFQHSSSIPENPTSQQILEDLFELSIGTYIRSAYRFRVSYTTQSCHPSEEGLGGNYEEYNLVFYRSCGGRNTTRTTTSTTAF